VLKTGDKEKAIMIIITKNNKSATENKIAAELIIFSSIQINLYEYNRRKEF
jgi:hypothetical protein